MTIPVHQKQREVDIGRWLVPWCHFQPKKRAFVIPAIPKISPAVSGVAFQGSGFSTIES
jgi:hypothetical protein